MGEQLGQVLSTASLLIRTTDLPVIIFLYHGIINILQTAKPKFLSINHFPDFLGENAIGYYHVGQLVRPRTQSRGHTAGKGTAGNQTDLCPTPEPSAPCLAATPGALPGHPLLDNAVALGPLCPAL